MALLSSLPRLFETAPAPIDSLTFPAGSAVAEAAPAAAGRGERPGAVSGTATDSAADGMADVMKMQRVHRDRRQYLARGGGWWCRTIYCCWTIY